MRVDVARPKQHTKLTPTGRTRHGRPPFARALQRQIDIPILSWDTQLDFAYSMVVHRDYYGYVQPPAWAPICAVRVRLSLLAQALCQNCRWQAPPVSAPSETCNNLHVTKAT